MANEFVARNGLIAQNNSTITGSLNVTAGITGSLQGTATTASYSLTASYTINGGGGNTVSTASLLTTASATSNVITFTKGDASTFNITVSTGSTFPYTGSAVISGSLIITGSTISTSGFTGSLQGTSSWATNAITASSADAFIVRGNFTVSGSTTIGDATTDSITMNAATMSLGSGTGILNIDSNTLVVNGSTNRVGINTTSPGSKLDVSGNDTTVNTAQFGTMGIQSFAVNNAWFGDNVYFNGSNFIRRANGYAGLFYFQGSEGQFRFGTTSTAGSAITNGSSLNGLVSLKTALDGTFAVGDLSSTSGVYTGAKFFVTGSGNVGIGTTSPTGILQVTLNTSDYQNIGGVNTPILIENTNANAQSSIVFFGNGLKRGKIRSDYQGNMSYHAFGTGSNWGQHVFYTIDEVGLGGVQSITLNSTGNVSIGPNYNPDTYRLDVSGDINFTGNLYQNGSLFGGGSGTTASIAEINSGSGANTVTPANQELSKYTSVNIYNFNNFS